MYDGHFIGGGFMWILWLVIIGLVVWAVAALAGGTGRARSIEAPPPAKSALEILEERYARGDIDREEFEQKKADLRR
ncbi:MAG: SHOCT domain-containing protein [Gammaproteobacteria bacterium]|nr:SHOCT domain-containing protein [Gammaproteobacteria bacterium]